MLFCIINTIGIGVGIYPNGFLSVKYFPQDKYFLQIIIGARPYYTKYIYERTIAYTFGMRCGYKLFEKGDAHHKYMHFFVGIGTGIHIKKEPALKKIEIIPVNELFPEMNFFPTKKFALEPNLGISLMKIKLHPFMGGGLHFYFE